METEQPLNARLLDPDTTPKNKDSKHVKDLLIQYRHLLHNPGVSPASSETVERSDADGEVQVEYNATKPEESSSLSDAVISLRSLLYQKLEEGEDAEALSILRRLLVEQSAEAEWKFLAARLLNEMGQVAESRKFLEEILAADPLSFEALFENAVLMDRCGEGDAVLKRLEGALELTQSEQEEVVARDVRLIMAQIQYLQKKVDEALSTYDELTREDPKDYRPYFCQGVIYTQLDRNKEAREMFAKYSELSEKKAEVNAYCRRHCRGSSSSELGIQGFYDYCSSVFQFQNGKLEVDE